MRPAAKSFARLGVVPLVGNLDDPATLARSPASPTRCCTWRRRPALAPLISAPRTCCRALARHAHVRRLVYASTSGVYGDAGGASDSTRREPCAPATERAQRRVDAERARALVRPSVGARVTVLRVPGIYAADRPGGHPRERLARGTPVLAAEDDAYTSHIHADDLARACVAALLRGLPQRVLHVCDDTEMKMSDCFDLAADLCGLPRPARITRAEAEETLSPLLAVVHERVTPARQPPHEARTAAARCATRQCVKGSSAERHRRPNGDWPRQ